VSGAGFSLLAATARSAHSQAAVTGRVSDDSGIAIARARVELAGLGDVATTTDSGGKFRLGDVMAGRDQLLVRQIGYQHADTIIDVSGPLVFSLDSARSPSVRSANSE
jgi:carboxypeptidase family protein